MTDLHERFHELANLFPLMPENELAALETDMVENKQRHPIVIFENKILDGRNRALVLHRIGVPARVEQFVGTYDEAVRFVISENIHRRHLTDSQRTIIAAKLVNLQHGQRADKEHGPIGPSSAITVGQAAEALKVTPRGVKRVTRIEAHGIPELITAMETENVSIAAAEAVAQLPVEAQREAVAAGPSGVRKAAQVARTARTPRQLTAAQQDLSRRRKAHQLLQNLVSLVTATKQAAKDVADGEAAVVVAEDRDMVRAVAAELRSVADWLEALTEVPAEQ